MARSKPSAQAIRDRNSKRYLHLRARYRAQCEKVSAPCHLCGQPIDYSVESGEVDAWELDHFHPVLTHPHLFEDPANFRPSHKGCNASRGDSPVTPTLGPLSEEW
ncbi:HNH endonuclease [Gordonia phage Trine]|uniref:HNH endonuclease n=1 Tax=Gordonia phage Trine TaxID=2201431 RepID=A0A2Z4Q8Z7_9CAUD|nr:HNH endonuclease [Gordonia phage Trine]AWY06566.1 HNH endonuclease [Gordonia phage Trine]